MNVVALDTHEVVKELKAAGFTDEQAEAVTRQLRRVQDIDLSNLATKTDLAAVATKVDLAAAATKADLAAVATKVDLAAAATKADLATMATKADLAAFATKADLATMASKADLAAFATKADLAETKAEILKWMVGTIGLQTVVIVGALLTLVRMLH
jgi:hypothetical protein